MAKAEKRRRWRKKRTGFGAAVGFLREYEQKKTGTASGSVTRSTMPLVQAGQWEPFKHCSGSAFLLFEMLNTELRSRWQRLRSAAGGGKSKQGLAQRSAFLQEYEQKKAETARECVTRFTMPLVQAGQGEPFKHCLCSAFLLFETLNTELRSRWQMLRSAAGG